MDEAKFDQWALVELFGHARIAGRVTEQQIGGASFIRVDVPDIEVRAREQVVHKRVKVDHREGFTRFFGASAIYSISPCSEEVARLAAAQIQAEPVIPWIPDARRMLSAYDGDGG